ncbi:hypothetical protein HHL23_21965 [Chryseobacterium sp. RP-3-3]|uniref:Uncharacterized protein n=1 Tax=Chryseobacterium antibioticum TaxID=2728847 RepID=A0A7Y0AS28_9FLAO|nr:hypothetical protein [Chryseobacterium antibioticum]NML72427.1 hypothetical protein [Chryseobacterium antibioticum]
MNYKFLIMLSPFIAFNTNCTSRQKVDTAVVTSNDVQKRSKIKKVEITEQTRGTNRLITFTPGSVTTTENGNVSVDVLSAVAWGNIIKQAELIDLDKIALWQSPSEGRFGDRALASTVSITVDGKAYQSSSFDSGRPPKELENLYRELFKEIKAQ